MIISRASAANALAISTSCRWEMVKSLTVVRGETFRPTWAVTLRVAASMVRQSIQPARDSMWPM